MKKIISLIVIALILVACGSSDEVDDNNIVIVNNDTSSYNFVKPIDSKYIRFEHSSKDYIEIGEGLVEISKEFFSTSEYDLKEGTYLSDFKNDYQPLVKYRESTDNPYGLNPEGSTTVKVNKIDEVAGPIFVEDILELNFVSKKNHSELGGLSLALVLNGTIYRDGVPISVDEDVLYDFATEIAGPKLESYLRKKAELANVPIVIGVFVVDKENDSIPGKYIAKAKYENRQGQFTKMNQYWLIFPTANARLLDATTDAKILSLQKSVSDWLPVDIGIIGYGEYVDAQLNRLKISVNVQTKTFTEILALTNHVGESIVSFDVSAPIIVEVKSMDKTLAIIIKKANTNKSEIIIL